LQVAEGALSSISDILTRMKELATQAASANVGTNITKVSNEYNTLILEIDRISSSAKYAGTALINGTFAAQTFQIGYDSSSSSQLSVSLVTVTASELGLASGNVATAGAAFLALGTINAAVQELADSRGTVGAVQNRLIYASNNLSITVENFTAAESTIRDVDMAAEMTNFTKNQILVQAGTAMLAQANMAPQLVLSLFGNG
jgi:flagellin